jgi:hypothetical protein
VVLRYYLGSCRESRLLVSWCVDDRCDMTNNDDNCDGSRRLGVEDQGWSNTGRILGGREIGRSGDAVCSLYRAHEDEERGFLG